MKGAAWPFSTGCSTRIPPCAGRRCAEASRAVGLVCDHVTWRGCGPPECGTHAFFAGEVEPCINGQVAASGACFGQDVGALVDRLLGEQLPDGGWNCEAENGSTRSSFNTTICVLEALLEYARGGARRPEVTAARLRGQEYLLARRLFRRLSTGEAIARDRKGPGVWTRFAFPPAAGSRSGRCACCAGSIGGVRSRPEAAAHPQMTPRTTSRSSR